MLSAEKRAEITDKPEFDLEELISFYHKNLNTQAYSFLEKRGIQHETADSFRLGFESGKIGFYVRENTLAEYFEDRIIVPVVQKDGTIADLVGKSIDFSEPDYKSLLGVEDVLFNEKALEDAPEIILVSNIFDVLTLEQVKLPAVCMPNKQQFKESMAGAFDGKRVFVCLSNDEAGRRESSRIESILKEHAKEIFIVQLPEKIRDVNDLFVKKEKPLEALTAILDRTIDETRKAPIASDEKYLTVFNEEYIKRHNGPAARWSTGLAGVDQLLSGGVASGVYLLVGPASCGKSMLLKQMADHISLHQQPVVFVTWDMTPFELWSRSMARLMGVSPQSVLFGQVDPDDINAANQSFTDIGRMQWTLECGSQMTPEDVYCYIEKIGVQAGKPPVIFIDSFYRLVFSVNGESAGMDQTDQLMFKIKQWSKEWNAPIIAAVSREDASGLADSLTAAADVILIMQAQEAESAQEKLVHLTLRKNRHGKLGETPLRFLDEKAVFVETL